MLYFLTALAATFLGAIAGLGGGVIIKPLLDALSGYDAVTIGIVSSCCVLTMAVVSTIKYSIARVPMNLRIIALLSVGAILGGWAGEQILSILVLTVSNNIVKLTQNIFLVFLLAFVLLYMNCWKSRYSFKMKHWAGVLSAGLMLGMLSSFLGIGGGPINVAALSLFFSMTVKEATVQSVAIILFSQLSKLFTIASGNGFYGHDLHVLFWMLPAAVLGGLLGATLNRRIKNAQILKIYDAALLVIIGISIYNSVVCGMKI